MMAELLGAEHAPGKELGGKPRPAPPSRKAMTETPCRGVAREKVGASCATLASAFSTLSDPACINYPVWPLPAEDKHG